MSNLKLPHWAQLACAFAIVVVTWVMNANANGSLVLPAAAVSGLVMLKTILGLLSPSVSPSTNLAAVKRAGLAVAAMCFVLGGALACQACFGAGSVQPSANLAVCVATDAYKGKPVAQIAIDCESDTLSVIASLLGSTDAKVIATPAATEARQAEKMLKAYP